MREAITDKRILHREYLVDTTLGDNEGLVQSYGTINEYMKERGQLIRNSEILNSIDQTGRKKDTNEPQIKYQMHFDNSYLLENNVAALLRLTSWCKGEFLRAKVVPYTHSIGKEKSLNVTLAGYDEEEVKRTLEEIKGLTNSFQDI